jgi:predicted dehydrogenase
MDRRKFLTTSIAAPTAYAGAPLVATGAPKKYRTALIGSGWWGMNILRAAIAHGRSKVVALCDVDQNYLDPAAAEVTQLSGDQPKKYKDYRELLDREKPDIVIVGTPDHWHPQVMIAAVKAGAHVYVEKPICHTVDEGKAMMQAARANGRMVQVGTHRRVSPHNISGMRFLKSSGAGKVGMVRCFVHSGRGPGKPTPDADPPAGLDWDLWCGPAPLRPFNPRIHPRGFRNFLDYANGTLGDWGIHWFDQVLWWTEEKFPKRIYSAGGRAIAQDNTDAPDTQIVTFEFESFTCTWEHRWYAGNNAEKARLGAYFYGDQGTFHMGWLDGWTFYPRDAKAQVRHEDPQLHQPDSQNIPELWADLLQSIETGRLPACDIEIGHRATAMSLLGMLSLKLGRSLEWDAAQQRIVGDAEANKLLRRPYRKPWEYPNA